MSEGGMDDFAQEEDKWRALAKTIMKLQVS